MTRTYAEWVSVIVSVARRKRTTHLVRSADISAARKVRTFCL